MKEGLPSIEEIQEMTKGISDISHLDLEDYNLINGGTATEADIARLKAKYQHRPDLFNVVVFYGDPKHPLYRKELFDMVK